MSALFIVKKKKLIVYIQKQHKWASKYIQYIRTIWNSVFYRYCCTCYLSVINSIQWV